MIDVLVGKVVGGSSAVNGMVLQRGTKSDYDAWATLGGKKSKWGWKDFLPYLKKVRDSSVQCSIALLMFGVVYPLCEAEQRIR